MSLTVDLDAMYEKSLELNLLKNTITEKVQNIVHKNELVKKRGVGIHLYPMKHQMDVFIFNCELNDINPADVREFQDKFGALEYKFVSENGDLHIIFQFK